MVLEAEIEVALEVDIKIDIIGMILKCNREDLVLKVEVSNKENQEYHLILKEII